MFVFSRFGPEFQPLDAVLLLVGFAFGCALVRRMLHDKARLLTIVMGLATIALVFVLGLAWVELEDGRIALLLAPIAAIAGLCGYRRLTGGNASAIGGALVALLLFLGAAPTLFGTLFPDLGDPEDISSAGSARGSYDATIIERNDSTRVVLRPNRFGFATLLDFPQRTVYTPGFGTEAAAVRWETPQRLIVEIYGSGEIVPPVRAHGEIEIVPSRGSPGIKSVVPQRPTPTHEPDQIPSAPREP